MRPLEYRAVAAVAFLAGMSLLGADQPVFSEPPAAVDAYDVTWHTPGKDSSGSMPLGNGDIGINLWCEPEGDVLFYIGKTDAWSENGRLLKLGLVRVSLAPNPFAAGRDFQQTLDLARGSIRITSGNDDQRDHFELAVYVDAHRPAIRLIGTSQRPSSVTVSLEPWRTERRVLEGDELHSAYNFLDAPFPVYVEPDTIVDDIADRIVWYHRNERSMWRANLERQGLGELIPTLEDPLLHRTFGGVIVGTVRDEDRESRPLAGRDASTLVSPGEAQTFTVTVYPLTLQTKTVAEWHTRLDQIIEPPASEPFPGLQAHERWWQSFWARSAIHARGSNEAFTVSRGYALQRFIQACAGRGAYPPKFNGSIFTVDADVDDHHYDADYRRWGGPYWWQNTRLMYWNMLAAGDFDSMHPLFRFYMDVLPMARERTRLYYGHDGAFLPETINFWGTYADNNYGWDRGDLPVPLTTNQYIRYYWQGGLELTALMLDYYAFTADETFLTHTLLPLATEIITFYDQHYERDEHGRLYLWPAQALETFWDVPNPAPPIAGLMHVLPRMLDLPDEHVTAEQKALWQRLLSELPPLPTRELDGQVVLSPAARIGKKSNVENPELYAVFPYTLYGLERDDLALARRTFEARLHKDSPGWGQDAIQAALLGLTDEAAREVVRRFSTSHEGSRFPAFWGPNYDWIPDQDHGAVAMIALQRMLMQTDGDRILLLPAWPEHWDVTFKLHAPKQTVVEGIYREGKLESLTVTPPSRRQDVTIMPN